jgi:hypothetical protein
MVTSQTVRDPTNCFSHDAAELDLGSKPDAL